jgi:mycofactocin system transcriptional regulator
MGRPAPAEGTDGWPARTGRPRLTSRRAIETVALRLFEEHGFEATTVDQISDAAGVSRRTFFRYFDTKGDVLWAEFDTEVQTLHELLAAAPAEQTIGAAIRAAVLAANHYSVDDVLELRARMQVINSVPALASGAIGHYDAWARALAEFAAGRLGQDPDDLLPKAIGFSALGACRAAYDYWVSRHDADLIAYLDQALTAWMLGIS